MVRGKKYIFHGGDINYRAAQEKADDLRKKGHKAIIRKELVVNRTAYVIYTR